MLKLAVDPVASPPLPPDSPLGGLPLVDTPCLFCVDCAEEACGFIQLSTIRVNY